MTKSMPSPNGTNYERATLRGALRGLAYDEAPDDVDTPEDDDDDATPASKLFALLKARMKPEDFQELTARMVQESLPANGTEMASDAALLAKDIAACRNGTGSFSYSDLMDRVARRGGRFPGRDAPVAGVGNGRGF